MSESHHVLGRLPSLLRAAGYSADFLAARLGIRVPDDVGQLNHAPTLERLLGDRTHAATLTRLFFLETDEAAARVFDQPIRHQLRRAGLLSQRAGRMRARLRLDPIGSHWLLSDRRFRSPDARALHLPKGDPVYPPSSDSLLLRDATVHRDAGAGLDLCTGSGVQALAVARNSRHVIAVDVSPRAAAMTRANATLNGLGNVDVRVGDLYRPVAGERFDVIIANPPFVPSPYRQGPAYHSGGPTGARVLQRIVTGVGNALEADGRFFAVSHLALRGNETVADVIRPWWRGFRGRVLVLVLESGSAIDLAAAQSLFALAGGFAAYAAEVRRWVAYLHRHGVREVVLLLLVAECGSRVDFEVTTAFQRTLPLPLSHPPRHHVEQWLARAH
ncbi:MAG TPA: methyltransferase [Candidatus Kryptonia bacterium]|nr:methyltransferase [Candidatus Kryptonia bacterium]